MKDWTTEKCSQKPEEFQKISNDTFILRKDIELLEDGSYTCQSRIITENEYTQLSAIFDMLGQATQVITGFQKENAIDEYTLELIEMGVLS